VKYAWIDSQRTQFPTELMCQVLAASRSGFFAWRHRQAFEQPDPDTRVREDLRDLHQQSRRLYGRRRLVHALRARGHCINPKRVRRLMREEGLRGVRKGRFVPRTTDGDHDRAIACNVLARRFSLDAGVAAWVSDITYVATREGWLYLAVIIALQSRQILGYSLAERMPDELVLNALRNACRLQPPAASTVFHSDRGSQYASDDFLAAIGALQMVASMSRKGNCWDNAVAESFFATLKAEEITEPYVSKQDAQRGIASYIHGFYNPLRLHSSLGYLSPNDYARKMKALDTPTFLRSAA
jgi:transposase InsO family protein